MKELQENLFMWSWFSKEKNYNFNSYMLLDGIDCILIDPVEIDIEEIRNIAVPSIIIITNKDHERFAEKLRDEFFAKIYAPELDTSEMELKPDITYKDGDILPGDLIAISINDSKSIGETALLWKERKILFVGDAVIGWPPGECSLLPAAKYKDTKKAKESVKELLKYDFDILLACDGEPILKDAKMAVERFLNRDNVNLSFPVNRN